MVVMNVAVAAYAGVFGRWYFGKLGPMTVPSFKVALTTSFGSICFGSLIVAAIRTLESVARWVRNTNSNLANVNVNLVVVLIAGCIEFCLSCIGDVIEYFNSWAYIQCAVRNASFCDAAKITWSMCKLANADAIFSDVLIGYVSGVLSWMSALVGMCIGGAIGYQMSPHPDYSHAGACAFAGFFAALIGGTCFSEILATGGKTIMVLWAEDSTPFERAHNSLHREFVAKAQGKLMIEQGQGGVAEMQDFSVSKSGAPDAKAQTYRY